MVRIDNFRKDNHNNYDDVDNNDELTHAIFATRTCTYTISNYSNIIQIVKLI